MRIPFWNYINARLVIPQTFDDCLTYGQRQEFMWKKIKELEDKIDELTPSNDDNSNND